MGREGMAAKPAMECGPDVSHLSGRLSKDLNDADYNGKAPSVKHPVALRGGAVLWYLRKNAPMPEDNALLRSLKGISSLGSAGSSEDDAPQGKNPAAKEDETGHADLAQRMKTKRDAQGHQGERIAPQSRPFTAGCTRRAGSRAAPDKLTPKRQRVPQLDFLHQAVTAIGLEVDEATACSKSWPPSRAPPCPAAANVFAATRERAKARAAATTTTPSREEGDPLKSRPASASYRDALRCSYARHIDLECESLEQQVADQQAHVSQLRNQVLTLERRLEATRLATANRRCRLRAGLVRSAEMLSCNRTDSEKLRQKEVDTLTRLRAQHALLEKVAIFDAEEARRDQDENEKDVLILESWKDQISSKQEEVDHLQATLDSRKQHQAKQIVARKENETSLFAAHTEVLALRGQALRMEARVHRLATELRKLYTTLPQIIQRQVDSNGEQNTAATADKLEDMIKHWKDQSFKYWPTSQLCEYTSQQCDEIEDGVVSCEMVDRVVLHGQEMADHLLQPAKAAEDSLTWLEAAWSTANKMSGQVQPGRDRDFLVPASMEALVMVAKAKNTISSVINLLCDIRSRADDRDKDSDGVSIGSMYSIMGEDCHASNSRPSSSRHMQQPEGRSPTPGLEDPLAAAPGTCEGGRSSTPSTRADTPAIDRASTPATRAGTPAGWPTSESTPATRAGTPAG